jgi:hypothetical protein
MCNELKYKWVQFEGAAAASYLAVAVPDESDFYKDWARNFLTVGPICGITRLKKGYFQCIPNRRLEQLQVAQAPPIPAAMHMGVV